MQNRIVKAHYQNLYLSTAETLVCQSQSPDLYLTITYTSDLKCTKVKDIGYKFIQCFTMVEENFQFKRSEMHQNQGYWVQVYSMLHHG